MLDCYHYFTCVVFWAFLQAWYILVLLQVQLMAHIDTCCYQSYAKEYKMVFSVPTGGWEVLIYILRLYIQLFQEVKYLWPKYEISTFIQKSNALAINNQLSWYYPEVLYVQVWWYWTIVVINKCINVPTTWFERQSVGKKIHSPSRIWTWHFWFIRQILYKVSR